MKIIAGNDTKPISKIEKFIHKHSEIDKKVAWYC